MKMLNTTIVKKFIFKSSFTLCSVIMLMSCSKSGLPGKGCATGGWIEEWTAAQKALSEAAQAQDGTVESCVNYKNAILDYLNSYEELKSCIPAGTRTDLAEEIEESRREAEEMDCSEG